MNQRFIFIIATITLILISGITFLFSKYLKINLEVSQKYENNNLSKEIQQMDFLSMISLIFLLILLVVLIGFLVISKTRIK